MARPAYKLLPGPTKTVNLGSVSRPAKPPKWRPVNQPAPRRVTNPQTI